MRVVIAGGGILGLMHAYSAVNRGHEVVHLEREAGPRGASVRNFGLIWVSGRANGAELDTALRARERWEQISQTVPGIGFRANGSLTVLRTPQEVKVAQEVCERADAGDRAFNLVEPDEARRINPALRGDFLAAVHCGLDAAVESRIVPQALREFLLGTGRYTWLPGREARELSEGPCLIDHLGVPHKADLIIQCTGAAHTGLSGHRLANAPLRRVRIQMMQTAPLSEPLTTSIADGDSMRYYPAWQTPALSALPAQQPIAAEGRMQLLTVQRLDGSLTIGDTHEYEEPFAFDVDERYYDHVRTVAAVVM